MAGIYFNGRVSSTTLWSILWLETLLGISREGGPDTLPILTCPGLARAQSGSQWYHQRVDGPRPTGRQAPQPQLCKPVLPSQTMWSPEGPHPHDELSRIPTRPGVPNACRPRGLQTVCPRERLSAGLVWGELHKSPHTHTQQPGQEGGPAKPNLAG